MYSLIGGIASIVITVILYFVVLGDSLLEAMCLITLGGVLLAGIIMGVASTGVLGALSAIF